MESREVLSWVESREVPCSVCAGQEESKASRAAARGTESGGALRALGAREVPREPEVALVAAEKVEVAVISRPETVMYGARLVSSKPSPPAGTTVAEALKCSSWPATRPGTGTVDGGLIDRTTKLWPEPPAAIAMMPVDMPEDLAMRIEELVRARDES